MKTVVEMENSGVIHMLKHNKIDGGFWVAFFFSFEEVAVVIII